MLNYSLKRIIDFTCIAGLLLFYPVGSPAAEASTQQDNIVFGWAFVAQTGTKEDPIVFSITRDTVLHSGDRLKMLIEKKSDCHIYLLYYANNTISQLFPGKKENSGDPSGSSGLTTYYIPEGDKWFVLDDQTGTEKFFLLSGAAPLVELELLLEQYDNAAEPQKQEIIEQVTTYIRGARKQHRQLVATAERPLQIGGTFRSTGEEARSALDIRSFAVEVRGNDFFARTFTIEHK
jgi:hypothetical protein